MHYCFLDGENSAAYRMGSPQGERRLWHCCEFNQCVHIPTYRRDRCARRWEMITALLCMSLPVSTDTNLGGTESPQGERWLRHCCEFTSVYRYQSRRDRVTSRWEIITTLLWVYQCLQILTKKRQVRQKVRDDYGTVVSLTSVYIYLGGTGVPEGERWLRHCCEFTSVYRYWPRRDRCAKRWEMITTLLWVYQCLQILTKKGQVCQKVRDDYDTVVSLPVSTDTNLGGTGSPQGERWLRHCCEFTSVYRYWPRRYRCARRWEMITALL